MTHDPKDTPASQEGLQEDRLEAEYFKEYTDRFWQYVDQQAQATQETLQEEGEG